MSKSNEVKDRLLGMPHGTASNRLRKMVLFSLLQKFNLNVCFRCNRLIETEQYLSLEHKTSWQSAPDPVAVFFSVENIVYSHLSCNSGAATKTNKIHASARDKWRVEKQRYMAVPGRKEARAARRRKPDVG